MNLLTVFLVLIAAGVALALVNRFLAKYMAASIVTLLNIAVVVVLVVWLLRISGAWAALSRVTF